MPRSRRRSGQPTEDVRGGSGEGLANPKPGTWRPRPGYGHTEGKEAAGDERARRPGRPATQTPGAPRPGRLQLPPPTWGGKPADELAGPGCRGMRDGPSSTE